MKDDAPNWKTKYYNALGELEAREKAWGETEQFLRQCMSRLTLAADSSNETLNRQLEKLRGLLRSGNNDHELKLLFESLSESIRQLDEKRRTQQETPTAAEVLEDVLGRIRFPRGMGHRAKALQQEMLQADESELDRLSEAFVTLVMDALQWVGENADPQEARPADKGGLLGKLFSRDEKAEPADAARHVAVDEALGVARQLLQQLIGDLVSEPGKREALRQRLDGCERERELFAIGRELVALLRPLTGDAVQELDTDDLPTHEVLLRLIERLDVPGELTEQVEKIKAMLVEALKPEAMEKAIAAIAELVALMHGRVQNEKRDIETFLKQMTQRLQEIDTTFQETVVTQREFFEGGRKLDRAVNDQVQEIESSVSQARDLEQLKLSLRQRVDTIRTHMQEFRKSGEQRLEQAERQVAMLTERLQSVQKESDGLRKRLMEERDLALIDPLTGIPNRFAYNERLEQEVARWRRYHSPLVLAVWDVDRFKRINDTYGHQAGDKVLTVIAKLLHKQVRETDFVARYGGEEFVLLLPETDLESAAIVTEQIRKSVETCEFHFRGTPVPITISCGMSQFREGDSPEEVFSRADAALYKAKESGRNQCRSA